MRTPSASPTTAGPAGQTAGAARRRSLRTRWTRALAVLLALFAAGGLASFAATRSTVGAFRQAALRMDQEADVLARLRADIVSSALLRSAAVQDPAADRRELDAAVAAEAASFERAVAVLRPGGGREIVRRQFARARELWSSDVTTLTPAQFLARVAEGRRNFDLLDEAGAASRAKARADLAGAAALERNLTVATAVAALVFIALVVRLARRLSTEVLGPVATLRDSAGRLAAGDLDHRVEVGRADEIGDLAATFNAMADFVATNHRSLTRRADHDPLTGLANRAAFHARLEAAMAPDRREGALAVLFVDLDDFKDVNDALGHAAGDALLCAVAARLTDAVRPGDLVARLGGDEFALLLERVPEPGVALGVARRAVSALATPVEVCGSWVRVGASAGLAMRHGGSDADTLMREADTAMYSAKGHGKNRVEAYDPAVHPPVAPPTGGGGAAGGDGAAVGIDRRRPERPGAGARAMICE